MMGTAEEGSCSMYFYESQTEVRIDFYKLTFHFYILRPIEWELIILITKI